MLQPPFSPASLVRFGVFELDLRSGELHKAGARITLQDQPLEILKALLEHPGELVTRDELRQRLWPADTFVDFEHGLNAAVKRLRDALGDSVDSPRYVETIPRRGYRLVLPIEARGHPRAVDAVATKAGRSRGRRLAWLATAGAAAVAIVATSASLLVRSGRESLADRSAVEPTMTLLTFDSGL